MQVNAVIQHLLFPVYSWVYLYSTHLNWILSTTESKDANRVLQTYTDDKIWLRETLLRLTHFHFRILNYIVHSGLVNKSVQINVVHLRKRLPPDCALKIAASHYRGLHVQTSRSIIYIWSIVDCKMTACFASIQHGGENIRLISVQAKVVCLWDYMRQHSTFDQYNIFLR